MQKHRGRTRRLSGGFIGGPRLRERRAGRRGARRSQGFGRGRGGFDAGQQAHSPGGRDPGQGRAIRRGSCSTGRHQIPDDVITIIPRHIAKKYRVVPVFKTEGKVAVAIADPSNLNTIDTLTICSTRKSSCAWRRSRTSKPRSTNITNKPASSDHLLRSFCVRVVGSFVEDSVPGRI